MDIEHMEPILMGMIAVMVGLTATASVVQAYAPPPPQFACPICDTRFYTHDQLYQHFITEHPAELLDIVWE